jgi:hypothetical protein
MIGPPGSDAFDAALAEGMDRAPYAAPGRVGLDELEIGGGHFAVAAALEIVGELLALGEAG